MTETLCNSGAVKLKAGYAVSIYLTSDHYTQLINQAEAAIGAATKINWVDLYATLDDDTKKILEDAASSHAAMGAINYDMLGYSRLSEVQTAQNINYTRYFDAIQLLKDKKTSDFIKGV